MIRPARKAIASRSCKPIARSAITCRCASGARFRRWGRQMGDEAEMRPKIPAVVLANAALAFPLPLAGEGAEQSKAGGGSLRDSQCGERPQPHSTLPREERERGRIERRFAFMSSLRKHRVHDDDGRA